MKTDAEVDAAYRVARKLARLILDRLHSPSNSDKILDFDDYVQEGMLAWLEGKSMYYAMVHAFRKAAKMSRYSYNIKGMKEPYTTPLDDRVDLTEDPQPEDRIIQSIDAQELLDLVSKIVDERAQFAVTAYIFFDMSLRDLGEVFGKSHEWVRTYLIDPELKKIREELKC